MLLSCGKALPVLDGIDSEKWKADRDACQGYRQSVAAAMKSELVKLKGLSEMDVIRLLGKPDENELYKRNQKFYSSFNTGSPIARVLIPLVRNWCSVSNAMGYAQLVSVE